MSELQHNRKTVVQLFFRLLFEVIPTIAICYLTLNFLNQSYTAFDTDLNHQVMWFGIGLVSSYVLYFYRARILFTILLLIAGYWIASLIVNNVPGEFDAFRTQVKFELYSTMFFFGWVFGFLLSRWKWASIIITVCLGCLTVASVSDTLDDPLQEYMMAHLLPIFVYALYMLFIAPVLSDIPDLDIRRTGKVFLRALLLIVLLSLVFYAESLHRKNEIAAVERLMMPHGGKGNNGRGGNDKDGPYDPNKGLLDQGEEDGKGQQGEQGQDGENGGGGYKLKDTMTLNNQMSQADFIMFCAKLKNFFPDGSPKPLYFVYHYLTKFDPEKESFIRDTAMPFFDEMRVDPSAIPMYRSKTDSTVIRNSLATKRRKVVESDVYISANTWKHALLGPAGTFSCQTIPVDTTYKKMFRSAYKIKSYVSDLNNAYFVYNPSANPMLENIQQQRFDELRTIRDYASTDPKLFTYYTQMPAGSLYDSIKNLAEQITKDAKTPIDKIIAIRDYFLARGEDGQRIYRYSLKAGAPSDPNIPNSGMLRRFIFQSHTGYCTYYAGASLLMLRSLGIPSRFTTGFATVDRADKNKGWYWFYASQAHAWTQVYFPGYGWLDFDMTIGNEDQREAPRPDGTPPLPPPSPWLVIEGKADVAPDKTKQLSVSFNRIIFFNDEYHLDRNFTREVDASLCRVMYGDKDTTLSAIHAGDSIFVVSYDDASKVVPQPKAGVKMEDQVEEFPKPVIADEIHIVPKQLDEEKRPDKKKQNEGNEKPLTWMQILIRILWMIAFLIVTITLIPSLWLWFLLTRKKFARDPKKKAYWIYRTALYHYHMCGAERGHETPLQYAETKADPNFHSGFVQFMNIYLRLKYAGGELEPGEARLMNDFSKRILSSGRKRIGFFSMIFAYTNVSRANRYFRRPADDDSAKLSINKENKTNPDYGSDNTSGKPE